MIRGTKTYVRRLLPAAVFLAVMALPALAFVMSERHFFEVPFTDEEHLSARLNIALGDVRIGRADRGFLFQGEIDLESDRLRPDFDYSKIDGRGRLRVDLDSDEDGRRSIGIGGLSSARSSKWTMLFGDEAPLDLEVKMGLCRSNLDFTGIPLTNLLIDSGASRSRIVFTRPNPVVMESMDIKAGASSFSARGLGNARAERIDFSGGAGSFYLDFSGNALQPGATAEVSVGMASLSIILPDEAPVVLNIADSWLTRVEIPVGYSRAEDGSWHSGHVRDPARAFKLTVKAGIGSVRFYRAQDAPDEEV